MSDFYPGPINLDYPVLLTYSLLIPSVICALIIVLKFRVNLSYVNVLNQAAIECRHTTT